MISEMAIKEFIKMIPTDGETKEEEFAGMQLQFCWVVGEININAMLVVQNVLLPFQSINL